MSKPLPTIPDIEHQVKPEAQVTLQKKNSFCNPQKPSISDNLQILLVEDDEIAGLVAQRVLQDLKYNVDWVKTGQEALEKASAQNYNLIFMDISLPDMDGYEITKQIRANENCNVSVPIIALSANVGKKQAATFIKAGINAVVTKPLNSIKAQNLLNAFIPNGSKEEFEQLEKLPKNESERGLVLNLHRLYRTFSREFAQNILKIALEQTPKDKEILHQAFEKQDWKSLRFMTHKISGTAAYCHAERLREISWCLDDFLIHTPCIDANDIVYITKLYSQVQSEIRDFMDELHEVEFD